MKVCIFRGSLKLVKKSGVGQAILHQEEMLRATGTEVTAHIEKDTEIVHVNTVFPDSLILSLVAGLIGKKVVYYGHSTMEDFKNSFKSSNLFAPLFKQWIRLCYESGDLIITPTEYSKKLLESYGIKKPIYALSNGVDTDFFTKNPTRRKAFREKYHLKSSEKAVLSVGHYIERKGILEFIRLAQKLPDIRFFWFGYTNLNLIPAKIREAILTAPGNLEFPGYVSREELRDAYCGCDLFTFMSYEETEGIVVLEALSAEIPVIVRDIPVYEGWLEDKKNVYKASDEDAFEALSIGILKNDLPSLTLEGLKTARQRSIPKMGKYLQKIYCHSCLLGKSQKAE